MAAKVIEFKGGDKLTAKLASIANKLGNGGTLNVGFLEGATYPNGLPVAAAAFWAEYGTVTEPPRPFFRPMIAAKSPRWGNLLAAAAKKADYDTKTTLGIAGEVIQGQLVDSLIHQPQVSLSEITLILRKMKDDDPQLVVTGKTVAEAAARAARGEKGATGTRAKPLNDTGWMLKSTGWEVKTGASGA